MSARFFKPFVELGASPRGLWYVIGAFVVESIAYFGILTLMTTYFSKDLHWPDAYASITVSVFTMLVTLFMLGLGSFAESFGLRRAIAVALLLSVVGSAVYWMMIVGSLVSAAPTFMLCAGPDLKLLIGYFFLFSIGEALWSARFLEYASELAPPGRVAQYMGLAQVPWLLAKGTTGLYSGYLLTTFCPRNTPPSQMHTGTLWLIYAMIAMTSPIGLWLARGWVQRGLQQSS